MNYRLSAVQQRAQSMKDELNNRGITHLDTFLHGVSEIEPPRYHWVKKQIQPPLVQAEFKEEATKYEIGNVLFPKGNIQRVVFHVKDGKCESHSSDDTIEGEDNALHIAVPLFVARDLKHLWEQKYQAITDHRDHINATRSLAYNDLKQKPRLAVNGKAPGSQLPGTTNLNDTPSYTPTFCKRVNGEPVPAHPTNKRQRIGLSSIPESDKIKSFNNLPDTLKIQFYDGMTEGKAAKYDNLEMAAWNVCTIHEYVGTEFAELGKAIKEMGQVLMGSHALFRQRGDKSKAMGKTDGVEESKHVEEPKEETAAPKEDNKHQEALLSGPKDSPHADEQSHPSVQNNVCQRDEESQRPPQRDNTRPSTHNKGQQLGDCSQLTDGVAKHLEQMRHQAAISQKTPRDGGAPAQDATKEPDNTIPSVENVPMTPNPPLKTRKRPTNAAKDAYQTAIDYVTSTGNTAVPRNMSVVIPAQNGRRIADHFVPTLEHMTKDLRLAPRWNGDRRAITAQSEVMHAKVGAQGPANGGQDTRMTQKGPTSSPSDDLSSYKAFPKQSKFPSGFEKESPPSTIKPTGPKFTPGPPVSDNGGLPQNPGRSGTMIFEKEALRPASASPIECRRQQMSAVSKFAGSVHRHASGTPPNPPKTPTTSAGSKQTHRVATIDLTGPHSGPSQNIPSGSRATQKQAPTPNDTPKPGPTIQQSHLDSSATSLMKTIQSSSYNSPTPPFEPLTSSERELFKSTEAHPKQDMPIHLGNSTLGAKKNPTNGVAPVAPMMGSVNTNEGERGGPTGPVFHKSVNGMYKNGGLNRGGGVL
ncbi:hypothetical protein P154DRAFT_572081 [Amniculicola lignicola CBS 123094]|uniref:Uncharacterized protein n=1 Tax=Amniculicola lignicola CBS 123094 TaxID=1392246 RepID=A0A6A5WRD9_9PLEO|nr:hypothetical protein P154DRAFT_572081 [Amniculicola lignicola CBS 123094]